MTKRYLGDGVYVSLDDRGVVLTTENGVLVTNAIVLDGEVLYALMVFLRAVMHHSERSVLADILLENEAEVSP